ncbi:hypothetical protein CICLE_v10027020mg [Citrus x clementina]|uniref:Uncharacterized protein n=1 Tax=Citrus clementina TaxID=85681 RepID=V4SFB2_CITCL|nr:hypothetical protein CICLE_v10027020mg [Citrus x clementina]
MPSLQTALPPELANNVIRVKSQHILFIVALSDESIFYLLINLHEQNFSFTESAFEELNTLVIRKNDRFDIKASNIFFSGWRVLENMHESNRISKDIISSQCNYVFVVCSAARGLINHILYESERLSGRKFSKSS